MVVRIDVSIPRLDLFSIFGHVRVIDQDKNNGFEVFFPIFNPLSSTPE